MIVFEGILVLYFPELLPLIDIKIFVDEDADIRLARRRTCSPTSVLRLICRGVGMRLLLAQHYCFWFLMCPLLAVRRDIAERGRDVQGVLKQYDLFVKVRLIAIGCRRQHQLSY